MEELGFKELYEVSLKTTLSIEMGGKTIEPGETIAFFDKIQLANFQEITNHYSANGGWGNQTLITWESIKEVRLNFTQGIFSKSQLALLYNAQLLEQSNEETFIVNKRGEYESDEYGIIHLEKNAIEPDFVYDKETGDKIVDKTCFDNTIKISDKYKTVIVDYCYVYRNGFTQINIGQPLTQGNLTLIGKMRVKDDTGKVITGIIKIPKLRLMSDLSIRVGSDAIPQVGRLEAVAVPEGARGQTKVMEIIFLNDDIDADI